MRRLPIVVWLQVLCFIFTYGGASYATEQRGELVFNGIPKAAIVTPQKPSDLESYAAQELQKYIGQLTGTTLNIITTREASSAPLGEALVLLGGPERNELVARTVAKVRDRFQNLSPEGFVLATTNLGNRPVLLIGGNTEAGTLYGAYDWLERQGVVFQITKDIIPKTIRTLTLEPLSIRSEPSFSQRGFGIASCYETRSIWSYPDIVKFIDQMAKLKLNFLIWHMFAPEPYLEYSYNGEKKRMGDEASWEGGYTLPAYDFGSRKVEDYFVGKAAFSKFGKMYMAPDEWQGVRDQDQVYAAARDLLQRVIRYAKSRNVKVWVALESLNEMSPTMARYARRAGPLPYRPFHSAYVCPTDKTVYKMNELRFKSLLQSYPEAAGFIFWMNEGYPVCHHPEDEELLKAENAKYAAIPEILKAYYPGDKPDSTIENSIGAINLVQKIIEVRDRISPQTKIGIGMWGRAYLLPMLDKILPKDILLIDNETSGVWTPNGVPMKLFGGMGNRDRIFMHVGDDDTGMIGMQFHVRLYYRDRMLEGSLQNGAAGVTELADRFRGEEHLAKYMAEGAWNPRLTPDEFYHKYAREIFGQRAEAPMFHAFMALEDMEGYHGYHGNKPDHITLMACCSPPDELKIAKRYAEQPDPYDGPAFKEWKTFVNLIPARIDLFSGELALEKQALGFMEQAASVADPGSLDELHYLENKTEAYAEMIDAFIQLDEAFASFDRAFQLDPRTQREEFLRRLDSSLVQFQQAKVVGRRSAETWSQVVDNVSDLGVLWRLNTYVVTGMDLVSQFMETIDDYHHGKPYLASVHWEKVFSPLPVIKDEDWF